MASYDLLINDTISLTKSSENTFLGSSIDSDKWGEIKAEIEKVEPSHVHLECVEKSGTQDIQSIVEHIKEHPTINTITLSHYSDCPHIDLFVEHLGDKIIKFAGNETVLKVAKDLPKLEEVNYKGDVKEHLDQLLALKVKKLNLQFSDFIDFEEIGKIHDKVTANPSLTHLKINVKIDFLNGFNEEAAKASFETLKSVNEKLHIYLGTEGSYLKKEDDLIEKAKLAKLNVDKFTEINKDFNLHIFLNTFVEAKKFPENVEDSIEAIVGHKNFSKSSDQQYSTSYQSNNCFVSFGITEDF